MLELVKPPSVKGWKVLTLPRLCAAPPALEGLISLLVCVNWARVSGTCYGLSSG